MPDLHEPAAPHEDDDSAVLRIPNALVVSQNSCYLNITGDEFEKLRVYAFFPDSDFLSSRRALFENQLNSN